MTIRKKEYKRGNADKKWTSVSSMLKKRRRRRRRRRREMRRRVTN